MASLDILCSNALNFENKIMEIEHKKMFRIWLINICLKYFMTPSKPLCPPPPPLPQILNVWSLSYKTVFISFIKLPIIHLDYIYLYK